MASFWDNFKKERNGERRTGLARWFQLLEEQFMKLFWANLLCLFWALPFLISLFFFLQLWDILSLLGMILGLMLLGPGFMAMTFICMQLIRGKPVFLWEDYKTSMRRDGVKASFYALLMGFLWGSLAYAIRLVSLIQGGIGPLLTVVFAVNAFVVMGLTLFGFQQIAMVSLPFSGVIRNAFLLIFAGRLRAACAVLFALLICGLCLWYYEYCVWYLVIGVPALLVMTFNLIFYPSFTELFLEEEK